jgi:hypothetical protein
MLGETSPGWRREQERKAERAQDRKAHKRHQRALGQRGGFVDESAKA